MKRILQLTITCFLLSLVASCGNSTSRSIKKGIKAFNKERYNEAIKQLTLSLEENPDNPNASQLYALLGCSLWKVGETQKANDAFYSSREKDPASFEATYNLGALFISQGDLIQGARLLEEAANLDTFDTTAYELLADQYLKNNLPSKARAALEKAKRRNPNSEAILTRLGIASLKTEGAEASANYFKQALDQNKKYAPALFNMASVQESGLGELSVAATTLKKYIEIEKNDARKNTAISKLQHIENEIAKNEAKKNIIANINKAQKNLQNNARETNGGDNPSIKNLVEPPAISGPREQINNFLELAESMAEQNSSGRSLSYCLQAAALAERNNLSALKEKALIKAVELNPEQAKAHYALGRHFSDIGNCTNAAASFAKCAALNPSWSDAQLAFVDASIQCHEYQAALTALRKLIQKFPQSAEVKWKLARFYDEQLEMKERALESYSEFIHEFKDDPRVKQAKARYKALNDGEEIIVHQATEKTTSNPNHELITAGTSSGNVVTPRINERAVTSDGKKIRAEAVRLYNKGTAFQRELQFDFAIAQYEKSILADKSYAPAHYNLGIIHQQKKNYDLAIKAYIEAIKLRPTLLNARYNLALVYKEQNKPDDAIRELQNVIRDNKSHSPSYYALGSMYAKSGNIPQAKIHYQRFITLAPDDAEATRVKAWLQNH